MLRQFTLISLITIVSGCTAKVTLVDGAHSVRSMTARTEQLYACEFLGSGSVSDLHANNVTPTIRNHAYMKGATHYRITEIISKDYRDRMSGANYDMYQCSNSYK